VSPHDPLQQDGVWTKFAELVVRQTESNNRRIDALETPKGFSGEWSRFLIGLAISALLAWGVVQAKLAVYETQMGYALERIGQLESLVRDLTREIDRYHGK